MSRVLFFTFLLLASSLSVAARADDGDVQDRMALQRRLADAGCWSGAADGRKSAELDAAIKACPDQNPILRVESGMHTAPIYGIGTDANCSLLATGSIDKTVRLWSLPEGKLLRTIRWPINLTGGGAVNFAVLSPDGRLVAFGGSSADQDPQGSQSLDILDLRSGAVRRVSGLESDALRARFSPDGRRIVVGLSGGSGIRVVDAETGAILMADRDYRNGVFSMAFAPDGSFITTSYDGKLRRYDRDLHLTAVVAASGGPQPYGIAVDPSGRRAVVGYINSTKLSYVDAVTLASQGQADTRKLTSGDLSAPAFARSGGDVLAGGRAQALFDGQWHDYLRRFGPDGRAVGADQPAALDSIADLVGCGAGFAYGTADPLIGLTTLDGPARTLQNRRTADMRGKLGDSFKTSSDAAVLRFGLAFQDADAVVMDLKSATLVRSPKGEDPQGLTAPNLVGLPITDWQDSTAPKFNGVKIPIGSGESSRVVAVRNDRSGFALGLDYSLRAFDSRGRQIWTRTVPGVSWGITLSQDGEVIVATHGDGTVRWYRWSDGRELLALFVDAPTLKWVAWTPTGYYMASPGGEDLVGWHLNRGWNQLADFFPASRFSARFNRPDIVQSILNTKDELIAVRNSDSVARRATVKTSVAATLPPIVAISGVSGGTSFTGDSVEIAYSLRSPSGASIDGVEALVDGRPLESRGLARIDAAPKEAGARKIVVPLPPHDVEVSLIARSGTMVGEAATIKLTYAGGVERTADVLKPKLYAVAIGVSDYANSELKLTYPSEDAKAFAEALAKQKGGIYGDVEVKVLVDRQVTRAAVISALKWLGKSTTSRDVAMVMFAGHGHNDDQNNYWFLPGDADVKDIEATAISQDDIMRQLRGVYGKTMLFLDTCHANQAVAAAGVSKRGFVDVNGFVSELAKAENGLIVFSSSQGRELSSESSQWKHGAFTLALLEGLAGKADLLHHGAITVSELDVYVAERVKTLTNGAQHPVMSRPNTVQDFPFAVPK